MNPLPPGPTLILFQVPGSGPALVLGGWGRVLLLKMRVRQNAPWGFASDMNLSGGKPKPLKPAAGADSREGGAKETERALAVSGCPFV